MRILKLTSQLEKRLLARRAQSDEEARCVASEIVSDVRKRGDAALLAWTKKLDHADFGVKNLWISQKEIDSAKRNVSSDFLRAIRQAARNIRRVAEEQLPRSWSLEVQPGVRISQRVVPIESAGCYIPGGGSSLVSTLLMTAVPAQVAGVPRIIAVCSKPNNELLAAANFLGIRELARIGGAQAIAALAYGTRFIPRVEKIFGPGNKYVTEAKQLVSADCAIDLPAGPTEAVVLAERGNARWIAADLLAQAEHAPDATSFLVTTSSAFAQRVSEEISAQFRAFSPDNHAHRSIRAANGLLRHIRSAGTIFLGPWGAQPLGDYISGSNHVLPTAGWARRRGGLSAADFVKCISVQTISRTGFVRLADGAETLAATESLEAHRNAVRIRR